MEIAGLPTTPTGKIRWAELTLAEIVAAHTEAKTTGRSDITSKARRAARRRAATLWTIAQAQANYRQRNTLSNLAFKAGVAARFDRFAVDAILAAAGTGRAILSVVEDAVRDTDGVAEARHARNAAHQTRRAAKEAAAAAQADQLAAAHARAALPATARQVEYIVDLLLTRSHEGGMTSTGHLMATINKVNRPAVEALTRSEAGHIIDSLTSNY